jgi:hypothetical protein
MTVPDLLRLLNLRQLFLVSFSKCMSSLDEPRQSVEEIEFLADPAAGELRVD